MARITVEDCLDKVENQYDLVLLAKERTSQLNSGAEMLVEEDNDKRTVIALREIAGGKLSVEELRKKVLCVSFTLLSNRLVFLNSKVNKINWDLILSCETLEVYKPNINAYLKTAKMLQLSPEECVMVACHSFDLNAAQKAGFNTIFVKRLNEWGPDTKISIDGNYDMVIEDFSELKEIFD